jgi:outer membrane protein assembly factor BamB
VPCRDWSRRLAQAGSAIAGSTAEGGGRARTMAEVDVGGTRLHAAARRAAGRGCRTAGAPGGPGAGPGGAGTRPGDRRPAARRRHGRVPGGRRPHRPPPRPRPGRRPAERWRFAVPFDPNDPAAAALAELLAVSSPAAVGGVVYAGALDGALYAVDAAGGGQRWRLATGVIGAVDGLAVADAGAQDGLLLAADAATGEERWRFALGPGSVANLPLPAVAGGVVYAGGGAGLLVAVDAASGEERWRLAVGGEAIGAPAVADGLVFVTAAADVGGGNAELVAVDAAAGAERWRVAVGNQPLHAAPAAAGGLVHVPGQGEAGAALLALDAASGAERWRYETGGFVVGNPATAEGRVFVATNHALVALEAATGREAWRVEGVESGLLSAPGPVVADGAVYAFAGQVDAIADEASGVVLAVEAASGAERWRYATDFAPSLLSSWNVAVADGLVFVPATGFLVALG